MVRLQLKVTPRAFKNEIVGFEDQILKLKVRAVAENGKANRAVVSLLAKALEVAPSRIRLVRPGASRHKWVELQDMTLEEIRERLSQYPRKGRWQYHPYFWVANHLERSEIARVS